jgi:argininosuccinate synthase
LPEEAYPSQLKKQNPEKLTLEFEKGHLVKINDKAYAHPSEAIVKLNEIASAFAIGRDTHVGDTIIGIKGRVGF